MPLDYSRTLDPKEASRAVEGLVPREMEDKWFILFEDGWLLFHRSWTGFCIYGIKLEKAPDGEGLRVADSWVSCEPSQYHPRDRSAEHATIDRLIDDMVSDERWSQLH